jgi:hypothetical protein
MAAKAAEPERSRKAGSPPPPAHQFKPGQSGCPGGRPKASYDFSRSAREYTPDVLAMLVRSLDARDWRERHSAAGILLDRALGKAPLKIEGDAAALTVNLLHLIAARHIAEQMQQAYAAGRSMPPPDERRTIDFSNPNAMIDLPPALE